jgi:DNA polymerase-3 subunit beta
VIPIGADREVKLDREVLRAALQRAAILSNEKYRGVRVEVSPGQLKISAHNPEQEEAQEEIEADTRVDNLAIGFNVNYLLDALAPCATSTSCCNCAMPIPRPWCAKPAASSAGTW